MISPIALDPVSQQKLIKVFNVVSSHNKIYARIGIIVDIALTILAFIAAYFIKKYLLPDPFRGLTIAPNYYNVLFLIIIIWYTTFYYMGTHKLSSQTSCAEITSRVFQSLLIGVVILNSLLYFLKIPDVSRLMQLIFIGLNFTMLVSYKVLLIKWGRQWALKERNQTNILFIGCNDATLEITQRIISHEYDGMYNILGCLYNPVHLDEKQVVSGFKSSGPIEKLEEFLRENVVDEIVISTPTADIDNFTKCLSLCENSGATIRILPDWGIGKPELQPRIGTVHFQYYFGLPTLSISSTQKESNAILLKYFLDYILSAFLLLLNLPLMAIIALAIKLSSKGSVLFSQERMGLYGRKFDMYKFRTMFENAEELKTEIESLNESDGPVFKIKDDPRLIPYIGRLMRKTGLDEIPQLINILKGDMSIVGPRPPIPSEVDKYDFWQRRRLSMKPGITCLWQISPHRNDISFTDWMKMDLHYIDNWSFGLDLKILLKTVVTVLKAQGR